MLNNAYKNVFYLSLNHMIMELSLLSHYGQLAVELYEQNDVNALQKKLTLQTALC